MRVIFLFLAILFTQCGPLDSLMGQDDSEVYLEASHIIGEWLRIKDEPSDVPGLFRKDTSIYRIGIDSVPIPDGVYKKQPLSFFINYQRGGSLYGYIYDPDESYNWEEEQSYLIYNYIYGLPEKPTEEIISFMMPYHDSLTIFIGGDTVGIRKQRDL